MTVGARQESSVGTAAGVELVASRIFLFSYFFYLEGTETVCIISRRYGDRLNNIYFI